MGVSRRTDVRLMLSRVAIWRLLTPRRKSERISVMC
jgi:hypothetical protein